MSSQHNHICTKCKQTYQCDGLTVDNYDGDPEVICLIYYKDDHTLCDDCFDLPKSICDYCNGQGGYADTDCRLEIWFV